MRKSLIIVTLVLLPTSSSLGNAPYFMGLGDLPGGQFASSARGISADGTVVVGFSESTEGTEAFRWTFSDGMAGLGDLSGGDFLSSASAISADGTTIVGESYSSNGREPFKWTQGSGMQGLGTLGSSVYNSTANDISSDGSVVVGVSFTGLNGGEAFRWTETTGMRGLGDIPGGDFYTSARGISADGSVIAGVGDGSYEGGHEAFRWTSQNGIESLNILSGDSRMTNVSGISPDGSCVAGTIHTDLGVQAMRWMEAEGFLVLGDLPGGNISGTARCASSNGDVIAGESSDGSALDGAFIWNTEYGMRSLKNVLINDIGLGLEGWNLTQAEAISADGLTLVGYGYNPSGNMEAWIAHLPEPTTISLFALGGVALLRRRR